MKIVVPMAGTGLRFSTAGFKEIKPLINVDGKPMIEHVCNMFPGEEDFIFVCKQDQLKDTDLRETLLRIKPNAEIVEISQKTLGPVHTTIFAEDLIGDDEEVIVSYCDFFQEWDYKKFLSTVRSGADGALPAFRGFHPASLGNTYYAYMLVDGKNRLKEIREKSSFSQNRMNDFASTGMHYFKYGRLMKKYAKELMNTQLPINGEYYFSLPFNLMVRDGLAVLVYEVDKFICWGTPRDLLQYNFWGSYFRYDVWRKMHPITKKRYNMTALIPAAGFDKRFEENGYDTKPLIDIAGKPMMQQSIKALPEAEKWVFVCREDHIKNYMLDRKIKEEIPNSTAISISSPTRGMAETCFLAEKHVDMDKPLLISACDYDLQYDEEKFDNLVKDETVDVIIWTLRNHESTIRDPYGYAYVLMGQDRALHISEKMPISDKPWADHAVVSTFYFRKASMFFDAVKKLLDIERSINGVFYVASSINEIIAAGKKVVPFEVDKFISWGTPADLKEYRYWKEYFDQKLPKHVRRAI